MTTDNSAVPQDRQPDRILALCIRRGAHHRDPTTKRLAEDLGISADRLWDVFREQGTLSKKAQRRLAELERAEAGE
jgi:hypothetical protein